MKIKFPKVAFLLFFGLFLNLSTAQSIPLKDIEAAKIISKDVTQLFKENKINQAFELLRKHWPLPENEIDDLQSQTIKSLNIIAERFGKPESIVKINEQNIKETAFRETYLLKFENTAIRLVFTYYKNNNGFILNAFKWDSDFDEEFK